MRFYQFYCYITTNLNRTVLYVGATNSLEQRLTEHFLSKHTFAGKYNCFNLVYFERFQYVNDAFTRELEIKGWNRMKKIKLIESLNPEWKFLNSQVMHWPPPADSKVRG